MEVLPKLKNTFLLHSNNGNITSKNDSNFKRSLFDTKKLLYSGIIKAQDYVRVCDIHKKEIP